MKTTRLLKPQKKTLSESKNMFRDSDGLMILVAELKPGNLLDLGTLDGSFPITICKQSWHTCVGVDLTKDGIGIAKERAKD
jgi:hypothetical protein